MPTPTPQPTIVDVTTAQAVVSRSRPISKRPATWRATRRRMSRRRSAERSSRSISTSAATSKGRRSGPARRRDARIRLEQARRRSSSSASGPTGGSERRPGDRQSAADAGTARRQRRRDISDQRFLAGQIDHRAARAGRKGIARAERLLETGDISRSIYDQRKSQRDALLGQLDEARSNAAVAIKAIDTAQAAVDTARARSASASGRRDRANAGRRRRRKRSADTVVYAPISGYVAERNADVGEYISPSTPNSKIATIVRTSTFCD